LTLIASGGNLVSAVVEVSVRAFRAFRCATAVPALLVVGLIAVSSCGGPDVTTEAGPSLEDHKQRMTDVLSKPDVVFLDADEACDCIVVGITGQSAEASVESFARSVGVPAERVETVLTKPFRTLASLRDAFRPTKGGLRIRNEDRQDCTMMAAVFNRARAKKGLLTNSHCTRTQNGVDGIEFFQAGGALVSGDYVAREVIDPPATTPVACPAGRVCRRSDAAYAEFDDGTDGIVGRLAQPSRMCTGASAACDVAMDDSTLELRVTGVAGAPTRGAMLHKIGQESGWTRGNVSRTCISANQSADGKDTNITLLCQHVVDAFADEGDSGSPVFELLPDDRAVLAGILWGRAEDKSAFVFSAIPEIEAELGAFDFHE
jgi:hypothetical protein